MEPIHVGDYLLIAEAHTGVAAEDLERQVRIALLESALAAPFATYAGHDFYPDFADKAAVLCSRLIRNHPLVDGNKRAAYDAMIMFIRLNGHEWTSPSADEGDTVLRDLTSREMSEPDFARWVAARIT